MDISSLEEAEKTRSTTGCRIEAPNQVSQQPEPHIGLGSGMREPTTWAKLRACPGGGFNKKNGLEASQQDRRRFSFQWGGLRRSLGVSCAQTALVALELVHQELRSCSHTLEVTRVRTHDQNPTPRAEFNNVCKANLTHPTATALAMPKDERHQTVKETPLSQGNVFTSLSSSTTT
jgi:hypothetical protein